MIGLSILVALFLYLLVSAGVVSWVVRWAKRKGRKPVRWGIFAGLVMYHLVFWDFIPTLVVYKYYCATKAGLFVYKTPEQWRVDNPGVAETLTWRERSKHYEAPDIALGFQLNERIVWIIKKRTATCSFIPVGINEQVIIDLVSHKTLVKFIGVSTGRPGTEITRFWTHFEPCFNGNKEFSYFITMYKKLGVQK